MGMEIVEGGTTSLFFKNGTVLFRTYFPSHPQKSNIVQYLEEKGEASTMVNNKQQKWVAYTMECNSSM